ncbi:MAG: hypothetical protein K2O78_03800 [Muribaculaceae bacterium]|nr:hypothetical protein [Muribaculaceae bacterium]MDE7080759.1 hypothetical protein [Muribaculaceae bacterium]
MHTNHQDYHIHPLLAGVVIVAGITLTACSGSDKERHADTLRESVKESAPAADTLAAPADHELTAQGVERIRVGMQTAHIAPSDEGVYDTMTKEEGNESNSYIFLYGGAPLFCAYEFTEGTIDVVSAESPHIVVRTPEGGVLRIGDEFSRVLALPGVEAEWEDSDDEGMWCWHWRGIWFQPDQSRLPEALSRELYSDVAPPAADAFTSEARIGYIGTGLPW